MKSNNTKPFTVPRTQPSVLSRLRMHTVFIRGVFRAERSPFRLVLLSTPFALAMVVMMALSFTIDPGTSVPHSHTTVSQHEVGEDIADTPSSKRELIVRKMAELRIARIDQAIAQARIQDGGGKDSRNQEPSSRTIDRMKRRESGNTVSLLI